MMEIKKQSLIKKTGFFAERKRKVKLITCVKLILIFIFCAMKFSVSAQTATQTAIKNAGKHAVVTIGLKDWLVAKNGYKIPGSDETYALLIYGRTATRVNQQFNSSTGANNYAESKLRTELELEYNQPNYDYYVDLRPIAVVPDLGILSDKSAITIPTARLAKDTINPRDIFFAPSFQDVRDVCENPNGAGSTSIALPFTNANNFVNRWWTRTPASNGVYEVYRSGNVLDGTPANSSNVDAIIAIWVKTSPLTYSISGTVYGLPSSPSSIQISYTVNNGSTQYVTASNVGSNKEYTIPNIPQGSNVVITSATVAGYKWYFTLPSPLTNNVAANITGKDIQYFVPGFTVNNEDYTAMNGKSYCNNFFLYVANPNTPTPITWKLDGVEIPNSSNLTTVFSIGVPNGNHTISMTVLNETYTANFFVGDFSMVWTAGANSNDWHNPNNWIPNTVPSSCNIVYIPGNLSYYPVLTSTNPGECRDIYFLFGAELGRPDLLTYQRAFVHYNFGLLQTTLIPNKDKNQVLVSNNTDDRLLFSASVSAPRMARERWYMLSAPLRGIVSGDLDFGGFPLTFLRKFGPVNKDNNLYQVGQWTTSYNSMVEPVSPDVANNRINGFAFYMYGYLTGGSSSRNLGCHETGIYGQDPVLDELKYFAYRSGNSYGVKKTSGILELPSFADSTTLYAHRNQVYNNSSKTSTFYYFSDGVNYLPDFNKITGATEFISRENNNGNYRFAPEIYNSGTNSWKFQNPVYHDMTGLGLNDEFLVGNPYMSSINMVEFYRDNQNSIDRSFRIWNGTAFDDYLVDLSTEKVTPTNQGSSPHISPLQGFFLKYKGSGTVRFDVGKISTVRPAYSQFNLRSSQETKEENIFRIKAENDYAATHALIGHKENASKGFDSNEDVQKLFSPFGYVPEIYSLADETPVGINFINNNSNIIIPLGIKIGQTGEISLTFTGMDNYSKASKIEFFDALENKTIDLTGKSSYTYSFINNETGIWNGRFSLFFESSITSLPDVAVDNVLNVYGSTRGIYVVSYEPVQKLEVYDLTGRRIYENYSNAKYYPLPNNLSNVPLIVKVTTKNGVKTVKVD